MEIQKALDLLDRSKDDNWTSDGLPSLVQLSKIMGRPVTREEVTKTDPKFTRVVPPPPLPPDPKKVLEEAEREAAAALAKKAAAQAELDAIIRAKEASEPPPHVKNQQAIRRFINSQAEQRRLRAQTLVTKPVDVRAPIDKAFQKGSGNRPK